jgi:hypothetical protein
MLNVYTYLNRLLSQFRSWIVPVLQARTIGRASSYTVPSDLMRDDDGVGDIYLDIVSGGWELGSLYMHQGAACCLPVS